MKFRTFISTSSCADFRSALYIEPAGFRLCAKATFLGLHVNGKRVFFAENVIYEFRQRKNCTGMVGYRQGGDRSSALARGAVGLTRPTALGCFCRELPLQRKSNSQGDLVMATAPFSICPLVCTTSKPFHIREWFFDARVRAF